MARRLIIAVLAVAVLVLSLLLHAERAASGSGQASGRHTVPVCDGPDTKPCAWHAPSMGGKHSYRVFRDGRRRVIPDRKAFHLLGDCSQYGPIYCRTVR